ncbi:MAG TPA: PEP-CTERM sorting domain-containing protein [Vicinamibacterales bacterium]|nr:PEP-CTERM sorting domain-containing protein [Vicinamibacterales bacterium]
MNIVHQQARTTSDFARTHLISFVVLLGILVPTLAGATPITYEIQWTLTATANAPDAPTAPSPTTYTYDPISGEFGGFITEWWGLEFDFAGLMNEFLSAGDRAVVASSLLSPESNHWRGATHSHNSPDFTLMLDPPGIAPFSLVFSDGSYIAYSAALAGLRQGLSEDAFSPECGEVPQGCGAEGSYAIREVTSVPEPSTLVLALTGGAGLLLVACGRGRRRIS